LGGAGSTETGIGSDIGTGEFGWTGLFGTSKDACVGGGLRIDNSGNRKHREREEFHFWNSKMQV